jgi:hypothetical protein
MDMKTNGTKITFALSAIVLMVLSCSFTAAAPAAISTNTSAPVLPVGAPPVVVTDTTSPSIVLTSLATATTAPVIAPTVELTATTAPASAGVSIAAGATGSLNIRRGPSNYYNVLAFLLGGQSQPALARNSEGSWLYISLPDQPAAYGWVSAVTAYSVVTGDIKTLPVRAAEAAVPIYIRNCTFHPMLVQPGAVLLKDQTYSPQNKAQFPVSTYKVYDQSVSNTLVKTITLAEGDSIDITKDGLNNTYACP